jgi:hypothetical protein
VINSQLRANTTHKTNIGIASQRFIGSSQSWFPWISRKLPCVRTHPRWLRGILARPDGRESGGGGHASVAGEASAGDRSWQRNRESGWSLKAPDFLRSRFSKEPIGIVDRLVRVMPSVAPQLPKWGGPLRLSA